jgi:hypothetical protein
MLVLLLVGNENMSSSPAEGAVDGANEVDAKESPPNPVSVVVDTSAPQTPLSTVDGAWNASFTEEGATSTPHPKEAELSTVDAKDVSATPCEAVLRGASSHPLNAEGVPAVVEERGAAELVVDAGQSNMFSSVALGVDAMLATLLP